MLGEGPREESRRVLKVYCDGIGMQSGINFIDFNDRGLHQSG
jgi:hypothetical protein